MARIGQYLVYCGVRVFVAVVQALSFRTCETLARLLATLFARVLKIRRKVIDENLRFAFPELTEPQRANVAWRMWEHLFLFVAEVAHTPRKVHSTNWKQYVVGVGDDVLVRLLLANRPLVMVSGHFGNFELCGYVMALWGYATHAVARPLDNEYLDAWIHRFRESTGQRILSKKGDYERIVDVLAEGGIVGFLADQYAGDKGCWVQFFGRPASAHKAIALFALNHDAPIVVGDCRRTGRLLEYEMQIDGIADPRCGGPEVRGVRELTQWYTTTLETLVRRAPEQYWWLHRRWKDHRAAGKRRAAA
jgi:KDO2-lipid IV(A) lauroyltransferase